MTEARKTFLLGALGILAFLALWEVAGQGRWLGLSWPPLSAVLALLVDENRQPLFARALGATLSSLGTGYLIGGAGGIAAAALAHLATPLRPGLERTNAFIHAIPSVALAPLLILVVGREGTPATLAALNTFFILYVSTASGLAATPPALKDLVQVLGGGRWTRLRRLDLPMALPTIVSGMRLAAPSALIGVIIGEWFGAPRGVGVLVINAMQNFQIPLLWAAVLLAVLVSLSLFGLFGALHRGVVARLR
ncbi:NitT/TauT family transport system permease protein [Roseomonas rosea]|uniref:NitT/TauT family transport system permease protein n=1 Tax=Muricoccus roseus TaxID=198092 RepID=A0A1M6FJT6_9PROT|nr:ABC transporter permease subunit [Roseomonas rosea]SHI97889.1 NitT/TauT family transport system permease protein [Roseomonas rosea]